MYEILYIIGVCYINQTTDAKEIFDNLDELMSIYSIKYPEARLLIGGDFNARIANKISCDSFQLPPSNKFTFKRKSLDTTINNRGIDLIDFAKRNKLFIANG